MAVPRAPCASFLSCMDNCLGWLHSSIKLFWGITLFEVFRQLYSTEPDFLQSSRSSSWRKFLQCFLLKMKTKERKSISKSHLQQGQRLILRSILPITEGKSPKSHYQKTPWPWISWGSQSQQVYISPTLQWTSLFIKPPCFMFQEQDWQVQLRQLRHWGQFSRGRRYSYFRIPSPWWVSAVGTQPFHQHRGLSNSRNIFLSFD